MINSSKEERILNWKWTAFSSIHFQMRWELKGYLKSLNFPAHKITVRFWFVKLEKFISLMAVLKSFGKSEKGDFYIFIELMIFTNKSRRNFCVNLVNVSLSQGHSLYQCYSNCMSQAIFQSWNKFNG